MAGSHSCIILDIALSKGGPEAIAESFYATMRNQQQPGGQGNNTLTMRSKLSWCLPSLRLCDEIIRESIKIYQEGDGGDIKRHRKNIFASNRNTDYNVSKVIDRVDENEGRCPFLNLSWIPIKTSLVDWLFLYRVYTLFCISTNARRAMHTVLCLDYITFQTPNYALFNHKVVKLLLTKKIFLWCCIQEWIHQWNVSVEKWVRKAHEVFGMRFRPPFQLATFRECLFLFSSIPREIEI